MGLIRTKANPDGLNRVLWMSVYFSNVYLKNFFKYMYSTLFN